MFAPNGAYIFWDGNVYSGHKYSQEIEIPTEAVEIGALIAIGPGEGISVDGQVVGLLVLIILMPVITSWVKKAAE